MDLCSGVSRASREFLDAEKGITMTEKPAPVLTFCSNPRCCYFPGLHRIVDHDAGTFKYYIKVVPTQYKPVRGMSGPMHFLSAVEESTSVALSSSCKIWTHIAIL